MIPKRAPRAGRRRRRVRAELARLQRLGDDLPDFVLVERLGDEVERAALERLDGGVDRAVGRDDDHGQIGVFVEGALEERHPVDLRHLEVGDDEVDVVLPHQVEALLAVFRGQDVVSVPRELGRQDPPQIRLVVDDEDLLSLGQHVRARSLSGARATLRGGVARTRSVRGAAGAPPMAPAASGGPLATRTQGE